jgi:hypothetical protein
LKQFDRASERRAALLEISGEQPFFFSSRFDLVGTHDEQNRTSNLMDRNGLSPLSEDPGHLRADSYQVLLRRQVK